MNIDYQKLMTLSFYALIVDCIQEIIDIIMCLLVIQKILAIFIIRLKWITADKDLINNNMPFTS